MAFFTTTDGCRLYHETHGMPKSKGDRPSLVFLNGSAQTAIQWRPQALFFKTEFPVVCYDARAQGKSDLGNRKLTLELHVEDLLSLLAFLQIDRAHLVGLSHGGQVAMAFSVRHPDKTARLILCGIGDDSSGRSRAIVRSWLQVLATEGLEAMARAALPVILGDSYLKMNEKILPKMADALATRNREKSLLAHLTALLDYPSTYENANRISHPCLVVAGSEDRVIEPTSARRLAEIIKAEYEEFEQTGHNVPVEAAGRFNRICRHFLMKASTS